jgi:hypothetical protein
LCDDNCLAGGGRETERTAVAQDHLSRSSSTACGAFLCSPGNGHVALCPDGRKSPLARTAVSILAAVNAKSSRRQSTTEPNPGALQVGRDRKWSHVQRGRRGVQERNPADQPLNDTTGIRCSRPGTNRWNTLPGGRCCLIAVLNTKPRWWAGGSPNMWRLRGSVPSHGTRPMKPCCGHSRVAG